MKKKRQNCMCKNVAAGVLIQKHQLSQQICCAWKTTTLLTQIPSSNMHSYSVRTHFVSDALGEVLFPHIQSSKNGSAEIVPYCGNQIQLLSGTYLQCCKWLPFDHMET